MTEFGIISNKKFSFMLTYKYFSSKFRYNSNENTKKVSVSFSEIKG